VAALEAEIGGACLRKGADAGELTSTGFHLVSMAREIQEGIGKIRSQSKSEEQGLEGRVGLTTVDGIVPLLHKPLARLAEQCPELCVDLIVANSGPSVRKYQVEVAIGVMFNPSEEFVSRPLFRIEYAVYGTEEAVLASPSRWILRGPPITSTPESDWEDKNAGHAAVRASTVASKLSLTLGGLGLALLPKRLAQLHPQLVEMPRYSASLSTLRPRNAWLLVHPDTRKIPRFRVLFDHLSQCLADS